MPYIRGERFFDDAHLLNFQDFQPSILSKCMFHQQNKTGRTKRKDITTDRNLTLHWMFQSQRNTVQQVYSLRYFKKVLQESMRSRVQCLVCNCPTAGEPGWGSGYLFEAGRLF